MKQGSDLTSSTSTDKIVSVLGGGPGGASAAIAAIREGAEVQILERSRLPRHKVCGEFLSPEIAPALDSLGLLAKFTASGPAPVRRMAVHLGSRAKLSRLPEPAFGLSRYSFDDLLFTQARNIGAQHSEQGNLATVIANGRGTSHRPRGTRLFGFKAHYEGPADDAVELFFFDRGVYIGINCIERGRTNVCGLGPESVLRSCNFEVDSLLQRCEPLKHRIDPLSRVMEWMFVGPLEYRQHWSRTDAYLCGDALSFVDPFTGSGLVSAVLTGSLAGTAAARGIPVQEYLREARQLLRRPFEVSSTLRWMAGTKWAERLIDFVPGPLLFRLTRPML